MYYCIIYYTIIHYTMISYTVINITCYTASTSLVLSGPNESDRRSIELRLRFLAASGSFVDEVSSPYIR